MKKIKPTTQQLTEMIAKVLDIAFGKELEITVDDFATVTKHALKSNRATLKGASAYGPSVLTDLRNMGYKFTF